MLHVTPGESMKTHKPKKPSSARRVQKHRKSLRASGLRPIQIWVPDIHQKGFVKECHRQSRLLQHDPQEAEILSFINSVSDNKGWT